MQNVYFYIFYFFIFFLFFCFYFIFELDPASPAQSLAQASDPAGLQARVVQTTRALHYLRPVLFSIESNVQNRR
jgi:hypothetical protein